MSNGSHHQSSPKSGNRDPFEAAKEQFLDALAADERLPGRQRSTLFKVGWKLVRHTNRQEFKKDGALISWPGLETMASDLKMEKHTILAAIRTLAAFKYLGATLGKPGRGTSNTYYLYTPNSAGNSADSAPFRQPEEIVPSQPEKVPGEIEKVPSRHINSAEPAHLEVPSRHQNLLNEPPDRTVEEPPEGTEGSPYRYRRDTYGGSSAYATDPNQTPPKVTSPTTSPDPSGGQKIAGENRDPGADREETVKAYRVAIKCYRCKETVSAPLIPVAAWEVVEKGIQQMECEYCGSKLGAEIDGCIDYPKSRFDPERAERAARRAERDRRKWEDLNYEPDPDEEYHQDNEPDPGDCSSPEEWPDAVE